MTRQRPPLCTPVSLQAGGDRRLGFGLYLAWAMSLRGSEPEVSIDLTTPLARAEAHGLLSTLSYCRDHGITGAA